jgi:hypothetical protein
MPTTTTLFDQFEDQGYVVVPNVLDPQRDLAPLIADYECVLDDLAQIWYGEGKVSSSYAGLPFNRRFIALISEADQPWSQFLDISLPQNNVTANTPIHLSAPVFNFLCTPGAFQLRATQAALAQRASKELSSTAARMGIMHSAPGRDQCIPGAVKRCLNCLTSDSTLPDPIGKPAS